MVRHPIPEPYSRSVELLAPIDLVARIADLIEQIGQAETPARIHVLMQDGIGLLGALQAYFVTFVRDHDGLAMCRFMLACDARWCRRYLDAGCQNHDPWLTYATHHSEPIAASALAVCAREHRQVVDLASQCGFVSTLLVPAHSGPSQSRISLLCLGSPTVGHFERNGLGALKIVARALACELHEWWSARLRRELLATTHISPTELTLMRHQCAGHSSKHIAAELHVSPSSIDSRFQRLHAKLGVPNRRQAARLLVDCGLILPPSTPHQALGANTADASSITRSVDR